MKTNLIPTISRRLASCLSGSRKALTTPCALAALLALSGCASDLGQRAQHADRLGHLAVDVLGTEHRHTAKVEIIPGGTVRVLSAHAVAKGGQIRIYGTLQPSRQISRGSGAHVHVFLVDGKGKAIGHGKDVYLVPAKSLRFQNNLPRRARFSVTLPNPEVASKVQIFHHSSADRAGRE